MRDLGRLVYIKELQSFGRVFKQAPDGRVEQVTVGWRNAKAKAMTADQNVVLPDIILVIELSVVVIKSIWDLWPVIKEIIYYIKRK